MNETPEMMLTDFHELPTIASHFPLDYGGNVRWNQFTGYCNLCKEEIEPDHFRGTVTHPFPKTFVLEGLGFCPECRLLTPFRYRLHQDMAITGIVPGTTDQWGRWERPRATWWRRWLNRMMPKKEIR